MHIIFEIHCCSRDLPVAGAGAATVGAAVVVGAGVVVMGAGVVLPLQI